MHSLVTLEHKQLATTRYWSSNLFKTKRFPEFSNVQFSQHYIFCGKQFSLVLLFRIIHFGAMLQVILQSLGVII